MGAKYDPQPLNSTSLEALRLRTEEELRQVGAAMVDDFIELTVLHAEPAKRFAGLMVYADGSDWDPGSGEGIYRYNIAGSWIYVG